MDDEIVKKIKGIQSEADQVERHADSASVALVAGVVTLSSASIYGLLSSFKGQYLAFIFLLPIVIGIAQQYANHKKSIWIGKHLYQKAVLWGQYLVTEMAKEEFISRNEEIAGLLRTAYAYAKLSETLMRACIATFCIVVAVVITSYISRDIGLLFTALLLLGYLMWPYMLRRAEKALDEGEEKYLAQAPATRPLS